MNLPDQTTAPKPRCTEIRSSRAFERRLRDDHKKLVVVQWMAPWAEPCRKIRVFYEKLAHKYSRSRFLIVNADERKQLSEKYEVESVPTFMFFHEKQKLEIETFTGAEEAKLEEAVERLNEIYSPWIGKGHSLINSCTPRHRNGRVRHKNPWADPKWVPPGMREGNNDHQKQMTLLSSPADHSNNSLSSNGWNSNSHPPQTTSLSRQAHSPAPDESNGASNEERDEGDDEHLLSAIHHSLNICSQVISNIPNALQETADKLVHEESAGLEKRPSVHDESLLDKYNIDRDILDQLVAMGFPQVRCEKALLRTKTNDVDDSLSWMWRHENDSDIDDPLRPRGSRSSRRSSRSENKHRPTTDETIGTDDLLERIRAQRRKYSSVEDEERDVRRNSRRRSNSRPSTDLDAIDQRLLEMHGSKRRSSKRRRGSRNKKDSKYDDSMS